MVHDGSFSANMRGRRARDNSSLGIASLGHHAVSTLALLGLPHEVSNSRTDHS